MQAFVLLDLLKRNHPLLRTGSRLRRPVDPGPVEEEELVLFEDALPPGRTLPPQPPRKRLVLLLGLGRQGDVNGVSLWPMLELDVSLSFFERHEQPVIFIPRFRLEEQHVGDGLDCFGGFLLGLFGGLLGLFKNFLQPQNFRLRRLKLLLTLIDSSSSGFDFLLLELGRVHLLLLHLTHLPRLSVFRSRWAAFFFLSCLSCRRAVGR
mmetsp:Transcript_29537/g.62753  ORF Transcript_29537/g.62753 Transcript_29537/m.62753 type:complete len:207 (-) Transcript_29537:277-897(-)